MFKLRQELRNVSYIDKNTTRFNETELHMLQEWSNLRKEFTSRWLITTLLTRTGDSIQEQLQYLLSLAGPKTDVLVHCRQGEIPCNESYIEQFLSVNHLSCHIYDPREGHTITESNVQGIKNGVTFCFYDWIKTCSLRIWTT